MPELPEVYRTPPDLTRYTEAARRDLYDRLVAIQFTSPDPATVEDPEDAWTPTQTPDEAELMIFYLFGRWFAVWRELPEPSLPDWRLTELVRIEADPTTPDGIMLYEV
ncbi:MAG TPA: hypothetical protein VGG20_24535 [Thermoanaerobaculia bacterium]|jgi:hypothetical protein